MAAFSRKRKGGRPASMHNRMRHGTQLGSWSKYTYREKNRHRLPPYCYRLPPIVLKGCKAIKERLHFPCSEWQ